VFPCVLVGARFALAKLETKTRFALAKLETQTCFALAKLETQTSLLARLPRQNKFKRPRVRP
jgi:hypothetical protein